MFVETLMIAQQLSWFQICPNIVKTDLIIFYCPRHKQRADAKSSGHYPNLSKYCPAFIGDQISPKRSLSLPTNNVHSQKKQQLCQRSKAFFEFSQFVFPFWATFCKIRGRPGKFYCFVLQKPTRDWGPSGHIRDIWTSARPWIFKDVWNLPGRQLSRYLSQIELF